MNTFKSFLLLSTLTFSLGCNAQVKNSKTATVRIDGDCGMCEKTIEKAGSMKSEADVDWDTDAKTARVTYDTTRTDMDAILQRVAQAGYDNERYLAPKEAYDKLPGCCQYDRSMLHAPLKGKGEDTHAEHQEHTTSDAHADHGSTTMEQSTATDQLKPVFDTYFLLKDALVASDANDAQIRANALDAALRNVKMEALENGAHMVWMNVMEPLANSTAVIAGTSDLAKQRKSFSELTDPMAELAKASPTGMPVYLDHCPMYEGGADWLSRDKPIKNPFYGSMMMTCGSVKETITK